MAGKCFFRQVSEVVEWHNWQIHHVIPWPCGTGLSNQVTFLPSRSSYPNLPKKDRSKIYGIQRHEGRNTKKKTNEHNFKIIEMQHNTQHRLFPLQLVCRQQAPSQWKQRLYAEGNYPFKVLSNA